MVNPETGPAPAEGGREPAIDIRGVQHAFGEGDGRKLVLHEIDLQLDPGQIVIMTGPSGSGKTTLLTLIGARRSVQEGSLLSGGPELRGRSGAEQIRARRRIGFIFQAHNLFDALTAHQNVRLALELHDLEPEEMDRRATEALERLGLGDRLHHKPQALSGGQRQRVAVARAIVGRPPVILADEPTAALDKKAGSVVVDLLEELARQQGATILIVTHDNRILDRADRIVNLLDGRIASDIDVKRSLEICNFLQGSSLFEDSSPGALSEISQSMERENRPAGEYVVTEGDLGQRFYLIRAGVAEVTQGRGTGERVIRRLGPGDHFGEIALLGEGVRSASVRAIEDLDLYTLDEEQFRRAMDRSVTFQDQLLNLFTQRAPD